MISNRDWILLLDDDTAFRHLISQILTSMGHSVYETASVNEANQALTMRLPSLAIVDYRLPDVDGVAWITSVREAGHNFPVVFVSADWCDPSLFNRLRNLLRVSLILQKPIVPELFMEQIEALLPPVDPSAAAGRGASGAHGVAAPQKADHRDVAMMMRSELRHPSSVQQSLRAAQRAYAKALPDAVRKLTILIRDAKDGDKNLLLTAINEVHKLRGSAGSFGFGAIGDAMAKVENLMRSLEHDQTTMQGLLWAEIIRLLSEVETDANEALSGDDDGQEGSSSSPRHVNPRHIILVGNDPGWLLSAEELFNGRVADASAVESADHAVVVALQREPDCVFFDLTSVSKTDVMKGLPEMRVGEDRSSVPLAFMVDSTTDLSAAEAVFLGASVVLQKPFIPATIVSAAQNLLALRESMMPRVLVLDDDEVLCDFIKAVLEPQHMAVRTMSDPIKLLQALDGFAPDVVLLDVLMPAISGYDVCRTIKETEKYKDMKVLFLTAKSTVDGRSSAYRAGADDFLTKPVVSEEVLSRVQAQLQSSHTLALRAERDNLTGLLQRTPLERATTALIETTRAKQTPVSLALVEVKQLRDYSMRYGLETGERLLAELGKVTQARFRAQDLRARLGDFVVILAPGADKQTLSEALSLLNDEFSTISFDAPDGTVFTTGIAYGASELWKDCEDAAGLIRIARQQLQENKTSQSV